LTLTFELGRDLCKVHLTAKFHRPVFNRLEGVVRTNKQTPPKTSTSFRYATPEVNKVYIIIIIVIIINYHCSRRCLDRSCYESCLSGQDETPRKSRDGNGLITGSIARMAQICRYLVYSEADFEVFRPAGASRCTSSVPNFTPIGATTRV